MYKVLFMTLIASTLALSGCGGRADSRTAYADQNDRADQKDRAATAQPAPNNSAVNDRDKTEELPGPMDQGQSAGDIEITRAIRQAVVAEKGFSMDAKNIKIITLESAVALRGPVATEAEKKQIGVIAESIPGVVKVFNLIDVETATK